MIGYALGLLVEHVLAPQADEARGERRAYLDIAPLDASAQALDVLATSTRPVAFEIGHGMTLRHEIGVAVEIQHGDNAEAVRIRDLVVLDLCLRAVDTAEAMTAATPDPDSGQYLTRVAWTVDYRSLAGGDTLNEYAVISFTLDAQLDR